MAQHHSTILCMTLTTLRILATVAQTSRCTYTLGQILELAEQASGERNRTALDTIR